MTHEIDGLQPEPVWKLFAGIASIPRGSKNEERVSRFIEKEAESNGCSVARDATGNMCIRVAATPGHEQAPAVVLQGHLDMVCEKNDDVSFNFECDPIRIVRDGHWIRADGTTLGADNGIGVAAALAAAFSPECVHGPLELLLTVDEETGLTGAAGLADNMLTGRMLINIDSETITSICIGCAGGGGVTSTLHLEYNDTPCNRDGAVISVCGLQGGHSGLNIHENRANAIRILARALRTLQPLGTEICVLAGGDKHNAIPREASAVICLPKETRLQARQLLDSLSDSLQGEYGGEHMELTLREAGVPDRIIRSDISARIIDMLAGLPNGVLALSRDVPGLVETSSNLACVSVCENILTVHNSPRSSNAASLQACTEQITSVARLAGCDSRVDEPYPGWTPDRDSKLLHIVDGEYRRLFDSSPVHSVTHAGLECGIIGAKYPGMDMVSIGADIVNCHSPDEAVRIKSVGMLWRLLVSVLGRIAETTDTGYNTG